MGRQVCRVAGPNASSLLPSLRPQGSRGPGVTRYLGAFDAEHGLHGTGGGIDPLVAVEDASGGDAQAVRQAGHLADRGLGAGRGVEKFGVGGLARVRGDLGARSRQNRLPIPRPPTSRSAPRSTPHHRSQSAQRHPHSLRSPTTASSAGLASAGEVPPEISAYDKYAAVDGLHYPRQRTDARQRSGLGAPSRYPDWSTDRTGWPACLYRRDRQSVEQRPYRGAGSARSARISARTRLGSAGRRHHRVQDRRRYPVVVRESRRIVHRDAGDVETGVGQCRLHRGGPHRTG